MNSNERIPSPWTEDGSELQSSALRPAHAGFFFFNAGKIVSYKNGYCQDGLQKCLDKYHDDGKEPAATAKIMSWVKTNVKFGEEDSDRTAADLITDGCNMGIKSLYKYLHQYKAANKETKDLTTKLIRAEETLVQDLREYL